MSLNLTVKQSQFNGNFVYVSASTMQRMKDETNWETPTSPLPLKYNEVLSNCSHRMVVTLGPHHFYYPCDVSCLLQPEEVLLSPCILEENGLVEGGVIEIFVVGYGLKYFSDKPLLKSVSLAFAMAGPTAPIEDLQLVRRRLVEMFGWQFVPVRVGQTLFFERGGVSGGLVHATEPPLPEGGVGRITDETTFLFFLEVDGERVGLDELRDHDDPDQIAKPTEEEMLRRRLESLSVSDIRDTSSLSINLDEVRIVNDYGEQ